MGVRTIALQSPWDGRDKPGHDEPSPSPAGHALGDRDPRYRVAKRRWACYHAA